MLSCPAKIKKRYTHDLESTFSSKVCLSNKRTCPAHNLNVSKCVFQSTNGAGLTTLTSSEPFVADNSPPVIGTVWVNTSESSVSLICFPSSIDGYMGAMIPDRLVDQLTSALSKSKLD